MKKIILRLFLFLIIHSNFVYCSQEIKTEDNINKNVIIDAATEKINNFKKSLNSINKEGIEIILIGILSSALGTALSGIHKDKNKIKYNTPFASTKWLTSPSLL